MHDDDQIVYLTIDGEEIETTPWHPFYTDEGWEDAGDLQPGDLILSLDGDYGTVESVVIVDETQTMYDLDVETVDTFAVGDGAWVVHNQDNDLIQSKLDNATQNAWLRLRSAAPGYNNIEFKPFVNSVRVNWDNDMRGQAGTRTFGRGVQIRVRQNVLAAYPNDVIEHMLVHEMIHATHIHSLWISGQASNNNMSIHEAYEIIRHYKASQGGAGNIYLELATEGRAWEITVGQTQPSQMVERIHNKHIRMYLTDFDVRYSDITKEQMDSEVARIRAELNCPF